MNQYMKLAVEEAENGIRAGHGGPFGCVIVKENQVVGRGHNEVVKQKDPTCHGEIMAIRNACQNLGTFNLAGCKLYTTAQPCPMCQGAVQWANITKIYYGCHISDIEKIGFRDKEFFSKSLETAEELDRPACLEVFQEYQNLKNKENY